MAETAGACEWFQPELHLRYYAACARSTLEVPALRIAFGNQTISTRAGELKVLTLGETQRLCAPASRQVCPYRVQSHRLGKNSTAHS